jgi:LPS sulfotransferase NodH
MPSRGYLVCCIERTGSTLLGGTLSRTEIAGHPIEYFNPVMQKTPRLLKILGDSNIVDGLSRILAAGTTANGLFGAKVHWGHFRFVGMLISGEWNDSLRTSMYDLLSSQRQKLLSQGAANELLDSGFPDLRSHDTAFRFLQSRMPDLRVIWLRRQNMVARAVSLFRARKTGVWYRELAKAVDSQGEPAPDFDLAEIHTLNCLGVFQENRWRRFFEEHEITPHTLSYEDLIADFEPSVRRILEFLNVDGGSTVISPPATRKQSDALSLEWEERYREAIAEAGS